MVATCGVFALRPEAVITMPFSGLPSRSTTTPAIGLAAHDLDRELVLPIGLELLVGQLAARVTLRFDLEVDEALARRVAEAEVAGRIGLRDEATFAARRRDHRVGLVAAGEEDRRVRHAGFRGLFDDAAEDLQADFEREVARVKPIVFAHLDLLVGF